METPVRISVPQLTKFGPGIIPSDDYKKKKKARKHNKKREGRHYLLERTLKQILPVKMRYYM